MFCSHRKKRAPQHAVAFLFSVIPTEVEGSRAVRRDFCLLHAEVLPFRVDALDRGDLFLPQPSVELLLSTDRGRDVVGGLAIDQPPDTILAGKPGNESVLVLVRGPSEVAAYACTEFNSGLPLCT